jgi:hypothetical protein
MAQIEKNKGSDLNRIASNKNSTEIAPTQSSVNIIMLRSYLSAKMPPNGEMNMGGIVLARTRALRARPLSGAKRCRAKRDAILKNQSPICCIKWERRYKLCLRMRGIQR